MKNKPFRVTELVWHFLKAVIEPGDKVVDATAGTGQDTLFLLESVGTTGKVFAFDIQEVALEKTRETLRGSAVSGQVTLFHASHETMCEVLKEHDIGEGSIRAIIFNLGYFPGGDHRIITKAESTIAALNSALSLLKMGGLITICLYPGHAGGLVECQAVIEWCQKLKAPFMAHQFQTLNRKLPPALILIQRLG